MTWQLHLSVCRAVCSPRQGTVALADTVDVYIVSEIIGTGKWQCESPAMAWPVGGTWQLVSVLQQEFLEFVMLLIFLVSIMLFILAVTVVFLPVMSLIVLIPFSLRLWNPTNTPYDKNLVNAWATQWLVVPMKELQNSLVCFKWEKKSLV
jgi:uncharacterized membrane protein